MTVEQNGCSAPTDSLLTKRKGFLAPYLLQRDHLSPPASCHKQRATVRRSRPPHFSYSSHTSSAFSFYPNTVRLSQKVTFTMAAPNRTYVADGRVLEKSVDLLRDYPTCPNANLSYSPPLSARVSRSIDNIYNFFGLYFVSLFSACALYLRSAC